MTRSPITLRSIRSRKAFVCHVILIVLATFSLALTNWGGPRGRSSAQRVAQAAGAQGIPEEEPLSPSGPRQLPSASSLPPELLHGAHCSRAAMARALSSRFRLDGVDLEGMDFAASSSEFVFPTAGLALSPRRHVSSPPRAALSRLCILRV